MLNRLPRRGTATRRSGVRGSMEPKTGFDKTASLPDCVEEGMIKRGVAETDAGAGTEAEGFVDLSKLQGKKP